MNESPNQALQRTAPAVTLAASASALPPAAQPSRQPLPSLSLGALGDFHAIPEMHPILAKTVEHIRAKHANRSDDLSSVIQDCAEAGFAPGFIIEGLRTVFQIPHGDAKRLVMSHFFRGDARAELQQFHSELEAEFLKDE